MTHMVREPEVIRDAVMLACHAPSLHNSQPWYWVAESGRLQLFVDRQQLVQVADGQIGSTIQTAQIRMALVATLANVNLGVVNRVPGKEALVGRDLMIDAYGELVPIDRLRCYRIFDDSVNPGLSLKLHLLLL